MEPEAGAVQGVVSPRLTAGCNWTKMSRLPGRAGIGSAPRVQETGWSWLDEAEMDTCSQETHTEGSGGVLQAGLLVFSATCGATLLLAACNGG
jgi:transcription elongation factor